MPTNGINNLHQPMEILDYGRNVKRYTVLAERRFGTGASWKVNTLSMARHETILLLPTVSFSGTSRTPQLATSSAPSPSRHAAAA